MTEQPPDPLIQAAIDAIHNAPDDTILNLADVIRTIYPVIADHVRLQGWVSFGTHVDEHPSIEFSELDEGGLPKWERVITTNTDPICVDLTPHHAHTGCAGIAWLP